MLFTRTTPLPQIGLWTFEPAFSPRFFFPLSPRSFFHTRQRFPISNHVTSGCMSPRSTFDHWSAVSPTGNDMTSSSGHVIALDQSGASIWAKRASFTTGVRNSRAKKLKLERTCGGGPVSPRSHLAALLIARALSYFARPLDYLKRDY